MTILLTLLSLLLTPLVQSAAPRQSTIEPFSLTISGPAVVRIGMPVNVKIVVANTSNHEISLLESSPECDYSTEVRSEGGAAPETDHKRQLVCTGATHVTRRFLKRLQPGESLVDHIVVSILNDMARPGRYSIQVLRKVPAELGPETAKSNVINVDVSE
jgi:hypothetical protein